jgi:outer membrane protein assembly factor BamB
VWRVGIAGSNVFNNTIPAIANGNVYVGGGINGGQVVCSFSLASGSQKWCASTGDGGNNTTISNGVLYVNTYNHGVFAFSASTGAQIWQYTPAAGNYSGQDDAPAVANGIVYVSGVGFNGNLYALNASTGAHIFDTNAAGSTAYTDSSPSIAHGVAYVACYSGLCAFNASTGAVLFEGPGNTGSNQMSPAVLNGVVYAGCGSNDVCAWGL